MFRHLIAPIPRPTVPRVGTGRALAAPARAAVGPRLGWLLFRHDPALAPAVARPIARPTPRRG